MDWERRFVLAGSPEAACCSRGEDLRDKRVHTQANVREAGEAEPAIEQGGAQRE